MYLSNIILKKQNWWSYIKKIINVAKILDICAKNFDDNFLFDM